MLLLHSIPERPIISLPSAALQVSTSPIAKGLLTKELSRMVLTMTFFFSRIPEYQPTSSDVIIDIGAHIGTFAIKAASRVPEGMVHAIEASRETFNYLKVNAALNRNLNIVPHLLTVADRDGEVTLHHDKGSWGHSIMKQLSPRGERVKAVSLGGFMAANQINDVSFIKFNCEGAEFPILMTTPLDTLIRVRMMLVLYHLDLVEESSLAALLGRLSEAGFKTDVRNKRKARGWIIASR